MKVNNKALLDVLSVNAINPNHSIPILTNFLLEVKNNILIVTTTDLEVTIIKKLKVENAVDGKWCIQSKLLEIVKSLGKEDIELEFGKDLMLKSSNGKYNLPIEDANEFPNINRSEGEFKPIELKRAISKVIFATGNDELRPLFTGVHLNGNEIVATDAHKLSKILVDDTKMKITIPKKACRYILQLDETNVRSNGKLLEIHDLDTLVIVTLIDGVYPNYNAVIPKEYTRTLEVDRNVLISALKRVSLFADKLTNTIELKLSSENIIKANNDSNQSGKEKIDGKFNGEPLRIGFNSKYLLEALNNIESDAVIMEFTDANRAVIINGEKDLLCLVMPVMLS